MQKKLWPVLSLLLLAALFATTATPALAAKEKSVTLLDIRFVLGKGIVFIFELDGEFKEKDLQGYVRVAYNDYPLSCSLKENNQVKCMSDKVGIGNFEGQSAAIYFAGFAFSGIIPGKPWYPCSSYEFTIWDVADSEGVTYTVDRTNFAYFLAALKADAQLYAYSYTCIP